MGIKYRVIDDKGKVIIRTKEAWNKYRKKEGYSLEIWLGTGKGWAYISGSTQHRKRNRLPITNEKQDNISDCVRGKCSECNRFDILGQGLCRKCCDRLMGTDKTYKRYQEVMA